MKKSLKTASQDYFDNQKLTDAQFNALEALVSAQTQSQPVKTISRRRIFTAAASLCGIAIMLSWFFLPSAQAPMSYKIATEAAKNHIYLKPLEVQSANFKTVSGYFELLDFSPVTSTVFDSFGYAMKGGRYCSIQTVTAAQLRYLDNKGNPITLFEVGYDPDRFGELPSIERGQQPIEHTVKGLAVKLWVEKDVLMVSVKQ